MKKFVLVKNYSSDFQAPVWERRWQEPGRDLSSTTRALSDVRTCSGFGVRSPFAILVSPHSVCTQTLGTTQTLADDMNSHHYLVHEDLARSIGEQICYGLHRLHQGLGRPYGALYPYNIGHDEGYDRNYFLWSAPTAGLESAHTPPEELDPRWDLPYRAPEVSYGEFSIEADIYGLGKILYEVSPQSVRDRYGELLEGQNADDGGPPLVSNLAEIILTTQRINPLHRFSDAVAFAMALNPKTRLKALDIKQGQEFLQRGLESFQLGEYDRAEELWSEARRNDWLSVAVWNNLAVCRMKRQSWEEANDHLKKALKLDFSNAVVRCNLAFCRFKLGKMEDAERYATEAVAMRPDLVAGRIVLSNVFFQKGLHELALAQAAEAIFWHPNSRGARWQHLRLLRKLGYEHEATRQESLLEALQYRVPFSDFLIDEMTDPPWGRIRRDESPSGNDDDDSDPDDTGSGVPRNPTAPRSGAGEKISNANYRAGMVRE